MKKILLTAGLATLLMSTNVVADSLKNSLMSAGEKDTPMVNLDNLKAKKKVVKKQKSRADDAVVATINGQNVIKEQTDQYLALRTQGRATDFDKLNKEQRLALVKEMSIPLLAAMKAQKELSVEEKNAALSRLWMQKKISMTKVEDKEAKKAYDKIKAQAKKSKKDAKVPTFEEAKQQIKMQMAQEKVIDALIKEGKVSLK
jgi:hypothetical protein